MMPSGYTFLQDMAAELLWHVPNYDLGDSLIPIHVRVTQMFGLWAHKPFVKWISGFISWVIAIVCQMELNCEEH